jgi:aromatic ring-opening dioxygenase LigB subunit
MLVFSAFVPHSPLLLESIGHEKTKLLKKTLAAFEMLEQELYAAKPDIVLVIGGHSNVQIDSFSIQFAPNYVTSFKEIGDFTSTREFKPATDFIQALKEKSINNFPLALTSDKVIDHSLAIPLQLLMGKLSKVQIVPIHHSLLDNQSNYNFGSELMEVVKQTGKRVAVIATGELSHCLTEDAPAKFNPIGKEFDDLVKNSLRKMSPKKLLALTDETSRLAQECSLKPLLILMGMMKDHASKTQILSYEFPFGVGYLTAHFLVR